ncbi:MAG: AmmeMemoRadiSam system protein B [Sedimenticola sp.]|nr:AmmeMemoRadiSam system protein B [Sedimenticola sp.]
MQTIKHPAVAGMFYPADPQSLQQEIEQFLSDAHPALTTPPKALVVPHAGYIYSGPIAASAYASLRAARDRINRVLILAPAHRVPFQGLAFSSASQFETPLGLIPVDREAVDRIHSLPQLQENDFAFRDEHSIEVQLPFLQQVLEEFSIVPLLVGDASDLQVAEVLEQLWDGDETLILISSDLSHYLEYEAATRMDRETTRAIEAMQPEAISYHHACGRTPLRGLLRVARAHGLKPTTLDLRNSGDTAGSHDRVVGYGAYVFN